jgi:hypothetical protein
MILAAGSWGKRVDVRDGVPVQGAVVDVQDWNEVVAAATRAPSIHNTQPWRFVGSGDRLEVHVDPERGLPILDPTHRQQVISCGVAVEFAAVALRAMGQDVEVDVAPEPGDPDHLATVRPVGDRAADEDDRALAAARSAIRPARPSCPERSRLRCSSGSRPRQGSTGSGWRT